MQTFLSPTPAVWATQLSGTAVFGLMPRDSGVLWSGLWRGRGAWIVGGAPVWSAVVESEGLFSVVWNARMWPGRVEGRMR